MRMLTIRKSRVLPFVALLALPSFENPRETNCLVWIPTTKATQTMKLLNPFWLGRSGQGNIQLAEDPEIKI